MQISGPNTVEENLAWIRGLGLLGLHWLLYGCWWDLVRVYDMWGAQSTLCQLRAEDFGCDPPTPLFRRPLTPPLPLPRPCLRPPSSCKDLELHKFSLSLQSLPVLLQTGGKVGNASGYFSCQCRCSSPHLVANELLKEFSHVCMAPT